MIPRITIGRRLPAGRYAPSDEGIAQRHGRPDKDARREPAPGPAPAAGVVADGVVAAGRVGGHAGLRPANIEPAPVGPTDGWLVFHPLPGGYDLNAVWAAAPSSAWAVGARGVIVHWNGEAVRRVDSPTDAELVDLDGRAGDDVYACGGEYLLHYDGRAWSFAARFYNQEIEALHCADDGRLYIAGDFGLRFRDGGGWHDVAGPTYRCAAIWAGDDGLVRAGDGGRVWLVQDGVAAHRAGTAGAAGVARGWSLPLRRAVRQPGRRLPPGRRRRLVGGDFGVVEHSGRPRPGRSHFRHRRRHRPPRFHEHVHLAQRLRPLDRRARPLGADGLLACGYGGTLMAGDRGGRRLHLAGDGRGSRFPAPQPASTVRTAATSGPRNGTGAILHFDGREWTCEHTACRPISASRASRRSPAASSRLGAATCSPCGIPPATGKTLPSPGAGLGYFRALAADSIFASTTAGVRLWNGAGWRDAGLPEGAGNGLATSASGVLYALSPGPPLTLKRWTGEGVRHRDDDPRPPRRHDVRLPGGRDAVDRRVRDGLPGAAGGVPHRDGGPVLVSAGVLTAVLPSWR